MFFSTTSAYGTTDVRDDYDQAVRCLRFGHQVQGGSFLQPSIDVVVPGSSGPGPIPCCVYQLGWLVAGQCRPYGTMLMLGLGSGSGAVALLNQFPSLNIIVVDVDVAVIQAARTGFPLVHHYEKEGRLTLVESCAWKYVAESVDSYDSILIDIYRGSNMGLHDQELLVNCAKLTDRIWVNHIGNAESTGPIIDCLEAVGQPVKYLFSGVLRQDWPEVDQNIILTTAKLYPDAISAFQPFGNLDPNEPAVIWAQEKYQALLETALVPDHQLE